MAYLLLERKLVGNDHAVQVAGRTWNVAVRYGVVLDEKNMSLVWDSKFPQTLYNKSD